MATVISADNSISLNSRTPARPKLACFSFAAYAKALLSHLRSSNIPVADGLSDSELSSIESAFNFSFPPDLRSILQQGLPIFPGFPNWRSSSRQQLQIQLSLPAFSILRKVSRSDFWHPSWGPEPRNKKQALDFTRRMLTQAPTLVPIYRHCYIPASPNFAGNPVFYIDQDGEVRLLSYDVAGFFTEAEFIKGCGMDAPAWAATEARRIEFWSDLADERIETRGWWWWWRTEDENLGGCLEDVFRRLRDGGWREAEIREMMMMMNGPDEKGGGSHKAVDREGVAFHVRLLSMVLLRAGWPMEDVVYSLGDVGFVDEGNGYLV